MRGLLEIGRQLLRRRGGLNPQALVGHLPTMEMPVVPTRPSVPDLGEQAPPARGASWPGELPWHGREGPPAGFEPPPRHVVVADNEWRLAAIARPGMCTYKPREVVR